MDSTKELLNRVRLGEDSNLEFKEVRFSGVRINSPHRDSLVDQIAAFSNSDGGTIIFGV